jgi:hypothetical protein
MGDLRLLLGQLQMIRLRKTALTFQDVKVGGTAGVEGRRGVPLGVPRFGAALMVR